MNKCIKHLGILIILMAFAATASAAPTITGVTNTAPTSDSVTITWATNDEASDSLVKYTNTSGTYTEYVAAKVVSHNVLLNGLSPNTAYNYVVNSTNDATG